MTASNDSRRITGAEVLRRYKEEDLPAFSEVALEDVNQIGNFGERPLHVASSRGNMEEITALVEAGAEVNAPGELGNTPLHEAVDQCHLSAVEFLLDHGASPDAKNEFGDTPIDKAKRAKREDIVQLLQRRSAGHA